MNSDQVAACIVTRGDVDLTPLLEPLPFATIGVWDNATGEDLSVYGRYAAIENVAEPVIYVQDDDVIVSRESVEALLAAYEPGKIVANMPAAFRDRYPDSCLLGFGAVFDRDLPMYAFARFHGGNCNGGHYSVARQARFFRTCDVIFTTMAPRVLLDLPITILPRAYDADRMCQQPEFEEERARMLELARKVRDESGQALGEWALILVLLAVLVVALISYAR